MKDFARGVIASRFFKLENCNKSTKNNLHKSKICYTILVLNQKNCKL